MNHNIANHVRAGYPGLYLVSHEETRIEADLAAVAKSLKYNLYAWSIAGGLVNLPPVNLRTPWSRWMLLRPSPACRRTPSSSSGTSTCTWRTITRSCYAPSRSP